MPRRKKRPATLTDDEVLRQLFPKEAREKVRKEARKAAPKEGKPVIKDKSK